MKTSEMIIKDLNEQLRKERMLRKELVERAFIAGRGKGSWAQFQNDNRFLIKSIINAKRTV